MQITHEKNLRLGFRETFHSWRWMCNDASKILCIYIYIFCIYVIYPSFWRIRACHEDVGQTMMARHLSIFIATGDAGKIWFASIEKFSIYYSDVIMSAMASLITSVSIVYSTVCSGTDERKHQRSASLAFVRGIHRWPVGSPHKRPVTREMFPFGDVIVSWRRDICQALKRPPGAWQMSTPR